MIGFIVFSCLYKCKNNLHLILGILMSRVSKLMLCLQVGHELVSALQLIRPSNPVPMLANPSANPNPNPKLPRLQVGHGLVSALQSVAPCSPPGSKPALGRTSLPDLLSSYGLEHSVQPAVQLVLDNGSYGAMWGQRPLAPFLLDHALSELCSLPGLASAMRAALQDLDVIEFFSAAQAAVNSQHQVASSSDGKWLLQVVISSFSKVVLRT